MEHGSSSERCPVQLRVALKANVVLKPDDETAGRSWERRADAAPDPIHMPPRHPRRGGASQLEREVLQAGEVNVEHPADRLEHRNPGKAHVTRKRRRLPDDSNGPDVCGLELNTAQHTREERRVREHVEHRMGNLKLYMPETSKSRGC